MCNPIFRQYVYYHCAKVSKGCKQTSITAFQIEKQTVDFLNQIKISDAFRKYAVQYLRELHEREAATVAGTLRATRKAHGECLRRMQNLIDLKTSPANADQTLISDEEYATQRLKLMNEKAQLEAVLNNEHDAMQPLLLAQKALDFAHTAVARFQTGDSATKKEILSTLGSNLTLKDKILNIEAKKPFTILKKLHTPQGRRIARIEPAINGSNIHQSGSFRSVNPPVRGGRDDVRTKSPFLNKSMRSIYRFYKKFTQTPSVIFPDWSMSGEKSLKDWKN
jgi:hypothetical protein